MDFERLPDVINDNTLCVLPIYHFGFPYEIDLPLKLAKENGFFVLEDTAQAPGATLNGKKLEHWETQVATAYVEVKTFLLLAVACL